MSFWKLWLLISPRIPRLPVIDELFLLLLAIVRNGGPHRLMSHALNLKLAKNLVRGHLSSSLVRRTSSKLGLKAYVEEQIGTGYTPDTIDVMKGLDSVAAFIHNQDCYVKKNFGSGDAQLVLAGCHPQTTNWRMKTEYFNYCRQPQYFTRGNQYIAEATAFNDSKFSNDFKFLVFKNKIRFVQVDLDRFTQHERLLYSLDWIKLDFNLHYPVSSRAEKQPDNFQKMCDIALSLARPFQLVRVDLYSNGKEVIVGELTHFHGGAGERVVPVSKTKDFNQLFSD